MNKDMNVINRVIEDVSHIEDILPVILMDITVIIIREVAQVIFTVLENLIIVPQILITLAAVDVQEIAVGVGAQVNVLLRVVMM